MSVSSENNKTIPHEIIFEILLRLPVKSLCRFKCVSSSWLALISDPQFVMLQLHRNKRRNLILSNLSRNSAYNYSIDEEKLVSVELDFHSNKMLTETVVVIWFALLVLAMAWCAQPLNPKFSLCSIL